MYLREYRPEDYPMLEGWWKEHKTNAPPSAMLPRLGVIAEINKIPTAAGFLYMDNSVGVCLFEFAVSNPRQPAKKIVVALEVVLDFIQKRAKELGYGVMMTSCHQSSLSRFYEENGFKVSNRNVTQLIKPI